MANKFRRGSNGRIFSCRYRVVWTTKYDKDVLLGDVGLRLEEVAKEVAEKDLFIIEDIEVTPHKVVCTIDVDPVFGIHKAVRAIKRRTSHVLRKEFPITKTRIPTLWNLAYCVTSLGRPSETIENKFIEAQKNESFFELS